MDAAPTGHRSGRRRTLVRAGRLSTGAYPVDAGHPPGIAFPQMRGGAHSVLVGCDEAEKKQIANIILAFWRPCDVLAVVRAPQHKLQIAYCNRFSRSVKRLTPVLALNSSNSSKNGRARRFRMGCAKEVRPARFLWVIRYSAR